jgi:quinol monooxygenase YgiN
MAIVKIQYTVADDYVDTNIKNIQAVMQELRALNKPHVRYTVYRDKATFMHVAESSTGMPGEVIGTLPAFTTFREMMKEHLVKPPDQTIFELVARSDS